MWLPHTARAGTREFLVVRATRKPGCVKGAPVRAEKKKSSSGLVLTAWLGTVEGLEQKPRSIGRKPGPGTSSGYQHLQPPPEINNHLWETGLQRRSLSRVQVFSFDSGEMGKPAVELHPCIGLMRPPLGRCGQDPYGSSKSWVAFLLHLCGVCAFNLWARPGRWDRKSKLPARLVLHVRPSTCISCAVVADGQSNGGIPRR